MTPPDSASHTIREIWQQPATWPETATLVAWAASSVAESLHQARAIVLTGSGSSEYVGHCVAPAIEAERGIPVVAIGGGTILTNPEQSLPASSVGLLVSIARSGNSPESWAAIDLTLAARPEWRHLVITCNSAGRIATEFASDDRVRVIVLDDRTNDRSLVMTSSFTNLALAVRFLGFVESVDAYKEKAGALSRCARTLLDTYTAAIEATARRPFHRAVYLGTGTRYGAAREASLKMLEMTEGRVATLAETYLGLRHGPMSFIDNDTLVVSFLSSSSPARDYELDLIRELNSKQLGCGSLIVGEAVPAELPRPGDCVVECPGLAQTGDDNAAVIHVVAGQLLALYRCLAEGLNPDAPSTRNIIARVVPGFQIHREGA